MWTRSSVAPFSLPFAILLLATASFVRAEPSSRLPEPEPIPPGGIHVLDGSCVVNIGELRVNITNHGLIGSQYSAGLTYSDAPSGEWPGGSGNEYLWGAGLWIGAMQGGAISVTTGQVDRELRPSDRVRDTIYEARAGVIRRPTPRVAATGMRMPHPDSDDDRDGRHDEDPLNGLDDDHDGRVDEDFGQLGDQMFSCTMRDDLPLIQEIYPAHLPLGVQVKQDAFGWDQGAGENIVGLDYEITNVGKHALEEVYLGFYVDCDIQRRNAGANQPDDLVGSFSGIVRASDGYYYRIEMGYMYDGAEDDPLPGYFGVLLCDHTTAFDGVTAPHYPKINSFQTFSTSAAVNQDGEPLADIDRYALMARNQKDRNAHPDEGADYKFLMSSGPFNPLPIGDSLEYSLAMVAGNGLPDLISTAAEAARLYGGRWYDMDNSWVSGYGGRETLVCLGDYPKGPFGEDPLFGRQVAQMDEVCTDGIREIGLRVITEENLEQGWVPDKLCIWVNMDNCTECLRSEGQDCYPGMERTRGSLRTGVGGRETHYPWSLYHPTPPAPPNARVEAGDSRVEVFWDDRSEKDVDPLLQVPDFESYRIWRVEEWTPPGDLSDDVAPPADAWGLVGEYDVVNEIPVEISGSFRAIPLGRNTGLEPARYEPACLADPRFTGLAENMQQIVDADPANLWLSRPPIRLPNGSVNPMMAAVARWETYPDVLDTFFAATAREADPADGIVGKAATRYYHHFDEKLHNGFSYYYAVTARDHLLTRLGDQYVPTGVGTEADPSNNSTRVQPRPEAQSAAQRREHGGNIYVFPNPATREALAEFLPQDPSGDNPTGVRVMFNNLPRAHNTIRIYTVSGDLLETVYHDGTDGDGSATWNLMTRNGQEVVSGIYLYAVHSDRDGFEPFRGRFVVIR